MRIKNTLFKTYLFTDVSFFFPSNLANAAAAACCVSSVNPVLFCGSTYSSECAEFPDDDDDELSFNL